MKIGTLCKVISKVSHLPTQYGDLVVITGYTHGVFICGTNLKTGQSHHYNPRELKEVKQ
jgi:hypothetical protein